jgi:serine protease
MGPGDYHISIISPCVDAGDNLAPELTTEDIDGESRIVDGNADGLSVTDMGADESSCVISVLTK